MRPNLISGLILGLFGLGILGVSTNWTAAAAVLMVVVADNLQRRRDW